MLFIDRRDIFSLRHVSVTQKKVSSNNNDRHINYYGEKFISLVIISKTYLTASHLVNPVQNLRWDRAGIITGLFIESNSGWINTQGVLTNRKHEKKQIQFLERFYRECTYIEQISKFSNKYHANRKILNFRYRRYSVQKYLHLSFMKIIIIYFLKY